MALHSFYIAAALAALITLGSCGERASSEEALAKIEEAYKAKDYQTLIKLVDDYEAVGDLLPSTANYWRGYVSDRQKKKPQAAGYWQKAIESASLSDDAEDVDILVRSASYLANQYCVSGQYKDVLTMAQPVVARLEELKCDTTSDYINLLIYIGLCQVSTGLSEDEAHQGFLRACEKHRQNIDRTHSDDAYKDAIAGLVNIAHYCVTAKKYEPALYYTRNFGELLIEYEQHPGADSAYVDRQVGRYTIYKACALKQLGRQAEAEETYHAFLNTKFSQSAEGKKLSENYQ